MSDSLGIDVGATTCAAAVSRGAALVPCELGEDGATMAAVALPRRDGTVLVGREADRLSTHEPGVVGRMVTDGLLDPEPVVVDGVPCHPLPLTEALISEVIARAGRAGASPEHVIVAFPLRGGGAPERLLAEAAHRATGGTAVLVPAPIAAAAKLAHDRDLGPAALVAVLDFGGTSVDVTLVRATPEVFDLVGEPISLTDLGGVDVDDAVVTLTESAIGDVRSTVAPDDRVAMLALRRLRASCRTAKERLATEDAAIVDVALSHARAQVEITQAALANAVAPMLDDAVDALMAVIDEAGLIPADLTAVLLVGGSARLPGLVELVEQRTGRPVVVEDEPELTVALGAALFGVVAHRMPAIADVPTAAPGRGVPSPLAVPYPPDPPVLDGPDATFPPDPPVLDGPDATFPPDPPVFDGPDATFPPDPPVFDGSDATVPLGPPPPAGPVAPPAPAAPLDSAFLAGLPTLDGPPEPAAPAGPFTPPDPGPVGGFHGPPEPEPFGGPFAPHAADAAGAFFGPPDPTPFAAPFASPAADVTPGAGLPPVGPVAAGYDPFGDGPPARSVFEDQAGASTADLPPDMRLAATPMPLTMPGDDLPARRTPMPPLRTGQVWPALEEGWTDDPDDDEWGPSGSRWGDARTSVFDDAPAGAAADQAGDWGQPADEEFRRLTTSDTDPFRSRSGSLATRLRSREQARDDEDEDDARPFDLRLVAGGALAAVVLVVLAGFAVLSGDGGSDPIAVADTAPPSTSATTDSQTSGTAALTANQTTTTSTSTTTTVPEEDDDPPYVPPTTDSPPVVPPPPPPPPPPTTTTTRPRPTTTTSTSTTTSTTTPPTTPPTTDPPGPPDD